LLASDFADKSWETDPNDVRCDPNGVGDPNETSGVDANDTMVDVGKVGG